MSVNADGREEEFGEVLGRLLERGNSNVLFLVLLREISLLRSAMSDSANLEELRTPLNTSSEILSEVVELLATEAPSRLN
mmetsp:Transcript_1259/g.2172  ORF Transcript_1259/g.2172 Transcript_1259/m.2172 type:complete len:80 (+) Transcript_1259:204-443(+)